MLVSTVRQHFRATLLRLDAPQAVQDWFACPFFDPRVVQKKRSFLFALVAPLHPNSEALRRDFRLSSMRALRATTSPSLWFFPLSAHTRFLNILLLGGSAYEPKKRSFSLTSHAPHPRHSMLKSCGASRSRRAARQTRTVNIVLGAGGGGRAKKREGAFFLHNPVSKYDVGEGQHGGGRR